MAFEKENREIDRERDLTTESTHRNREQAVRENEPDRNEDPITGETGAHPVGAGLGAAVGGAAAGAAIGTVAGPVGTAAGIVGGGLVGGLAGKAIAERIDPTEEEHYWRNQYPNREYYDENVGYEQIGPAYRYGWESRANHPERSWDEAEADLAREWDTRRGSSSLDWQRARPATRDAWQRIDMIVVEVDDDTGQQTGDTAATKQAGPPHKPK